jgi:hypothetical protein
MMMDRAIRKKVSVEVLRCEPQRTRLFAQDDSSGGKFLRGPDAGFFGKRIEGAFEHGPADLD